MLKITPGIVRGAYEFLTLTEPFVKWNLPNAEDVQFRVGKPNDNSQAWHEYDPNNGRHEIGVSVKVISLTDTLLQAVAHEMIHMHQALTKTYTGKVMHNKAFVKWAEKVCTAHGWDAKLFVV